MRAQDAEPIYAAYLDLELQFLELRTGFTTQQHLLQDFQVRKGLLGGLLGVGCAVHERLAPRRHLLVHAIVVAAELLLRRLAPIPGDGHLAAVDDDAAILARDGILVTGKGRAERVRVGARNAGLGIPDGVDGVDGWQMLLQQGRVGGYRLGLGVRTQEEPRASDEVHTTIQKEAALVVGLLAPRRLCASRQLPGREEGDQQTQTHRSTCCPP